MLAAADPNGPSRRRRRRPLAAILGVAVALGIAGCAGGSGGSTSANTPPLVTGEQVVTACFHSYFYNGILPKGPAEANCRSCVVTQLRKLGVQPPAGQTVLDMLTGERLSSSDIQTLQGACNVTDASSQ